MASKKGSLVRSRWVIGMIYSFVRVYSGTFRLKVVNEEAWISHLEAGNKVLLCAWHQQFFPCISYFRHYSKYNPSLMISRSNDGEIVARVAEKMGWQVARGSSSTGGLSAYMQMVKNIKSNGLAAHILDGPRGPIGEVKKGGIRLACDSGAVIVPVYTHAEKAHFFRSWDKFFVPKLGSQVTIEFGDAIQFEPTDETEKMESYRKSLEELMRPRILEAPSA